MTAPVLRVHHVSVGHPGSWILQDINLRVDAGHFLGIVGPNGAGKGTLLQVIAGMRSPDAGHIDLFGECLSANNRKRLLRRVGFLSQRQEEIPQLPVRVRDVVAMGMPTYHGPLWVRSDRGGSLDRVMALVGIRELADRDFRRLSGGQQQRVRLARALVASPSLLLLDEPTAALDARAQSGLYRLLRELCDRHRMAVIMVEHDIAAISNYVDSMACLNIRIHYHARRGDKVPEDVWQAMYGGDMHAVAHDVHCIGCTDRDENG